MLALLLFLFGVAAAILAYVGLLALPVIFGGVAVALAFAKGFTMVRGRLWWEVDSARASWMVKREHARLTGQNDPDQGLLLAHLADVEYGKVLRRASRFIWQFDEQHTGLTNPSRNNPGEIDQVLAKALHEKHRPKHRPQVPLRYTPPRLQYEYVRTATGQNQLGSGDD